eukprot:26367_1
MSPVIIPITLKCTRTYSYRKLQSKICLVHVFVTRSTHTSMKQRKSLSNIVATKILKSLYTKHQNNTTNSKLILSATSVYNSVDEAKDYIVINAFLKICLHFKHPDKVSMLWSDIESLSHQHKSKLLHSHLLKCCIHNDAQSIDKCLEVLVMMQQCEYKLKIHSSWITKLVIKGKDNLSALNRIKSLMDSGYIPNDVMCRTVVINSYARCGAMDYALNVFQSIHDTEKDSTCISTMMKAYIGNHRFDDALALYEEYDVLNDHVSHLYAIKACIQSGNVQKGKKIHSKLKLPDIKVKCALIEFYGICGDMDNALKLYHPHNIVMSSAMMNAYIRNDLHTDALALYHDITQPDIVSHILALKACIYSRDREAGITIINTIKTDDVQIKTALVEFYSHFHDMSAAAETFRSIDKIRMPINAINAMMRGYINDEDYTSAIHLYDTYQCHRLNDVSHILASIVNPHYLNHVKCFANPRYLDIDQFVHILDIAMHCDHLVLPGSFVVRAIAKCGSNKVLINKLDAMIKQLPIQLQKDRLIVQTALITAYGNKCQSVDDAQRVFDSIANDEKDTVCVGAMMKVLGSAGKHKEVLQLYKQYDVLNDDVSHLLALQSCAEMDDLQMGQHIHASIHVSHLIANALLNLYGKCGDIDNAIRIFDGLTASGKQDVVSVGSMLNALCKSRRNKECLALFKEMKSKYDVEPNLICYAIVLTACTQSTSFYFGELIHKELMRNTHLQWMLHDEEIQSPLISMYGKCGMLQQAQQIFDNIKHNEPRKYATNVSIWNAMIHSYGRNGQISKANELYWQMMAMDSLRPDAQTYVLFMNACSHAGDVDKARQMWNDISIKYDAQLVTALVDCLARKGHLHEALKRINEFEMNTNESYAAMWMSLLFGCNKTNHIDIAESVFKGMQHRFKPNDAHMISAKVLMSNIYVTAKQFDKASRIRNTMKHDKLKKIPAVSEIDIFGKLHTFYASNKHHEPCVDEGLNKLYHKLKLSPFNYEPDLTCITRELSKHEEADQVLLMHSEKIALVYGLIHTPKDYLLVINKNLRICNDCHNFIKLVSKMEQRSITVADANRVHVFNDGQCSCNNYY